MRRSSFWMITLFTLAQLSRAPAAQEPEFRPEMLLPEKTIAYISLPTSGAYLDRLLETATGEIWKHEEVQRFLKRPLEKLRESFGTWAEIQVRRHGVDPRKLLSPWPDRIAAAVLEWDQERDEPSGAFIALRFPGAEKKARELVEKLLQVSFKESKPERTRYEHAGADVIRLVAREEGEDSMLSVAEFTFRSDWLLVIYDEVEEGKTGANLRRLLDQKGGLPGAKSFQAAVERLRFTGAEPFLFTNVKEIWTGIQHMVEKEKKEEGSGPDVFTILDGLGISGIRSMAWTQRIDGKSIGDDFFLEAPAPRKGILEVLSSVTTRGELARFMTGDSQTYQEISLNWSGLWNLVMSTVKASTDEEAYKEFQEGIASAEKTTGFSFEKELLPCFGSKIAVGGTVGQLPAGIGKNMFVLEVKDGKKLEEILARLRELPAVQESLIIKDGNHEGVETTSVTIRNIPIPLQPSFAITEGHLLLSESPATLQAMINCLRGKEKGLDQTPAFLEHRDAAFGKGAIGGSYYDLKGYVGATYTALASVLGMAFSMNPNSKKELDELGIDFALLPSQSAISGPLFPGTETFRFDDAGFYYSGSSPIGAPALGIFKLVFGIAGAFGAGEWIQEEIEEDREKICRENLEKIRDALGVYRETTGSGSPPRDLMELVTSRALEDASHLRCPSDRSPRKVTDPDTGENVEVSYQYSSENYGKGEKPKKVVQEPDRERHRNGSHALYSDGSIRKIWKWDREEEPKGHSH